MLPAQPKQVCVLECVSVRLCVVCACVDVCEHVNVFLSLGVVSSFSCLISTTRTGPHFMPRYPLHPESHIATWKPCFLWAQCYNQHYNL